MSERDDIKTQIAEIEAKLATFTTVNDEYSKLVRKRNNLQRKLNFPPVKYSDYQHIPGILVRCGRSQCNGLVAIFMRDAQGRLHVPKPEPYPKRKYVDEATAESDRLNDLAWTKQNRESGLTADRTYVDYKHDRLSCPLCGHKMRISPVTAIKVLQPILDQLETIPWEQWDSALNGVIVFENRNLPRTLGNASLTVESLERLAA